MISHRQQRGYLLITVVVTLFLLATVAVMLTQGSAINANTARSELESARAEYVARAGMQHATWRAQNNVCMGDVTIPDTALGKDIYSATITGANPGTLHKLSSDQDAWIRNDDVTKNNGKTADQHIRLETGIVEQALTRFDLSSLPKDAQILSATASFYVTPSGPGGGAHPAGPLTVHQVTEDWTETGATWETMNGKFEKSRIATIPAQPVDSVWASINLTAQVQAWVNGQPNYGILMAPTAEGTHGKYSSREDGGNAPRLEVVVGSGSASPVTISATGELGNGVERKLKDKLTVAYQPPTTVELQLGTDPGADATLDDFYPRNYGGRDFVEVHEDAGSWVQRPVFRFGLGGVPPGSRVLAAQLELRLRGIKSPGTATIHLVTRNWVEGTKSGTGTADGATWATYDGINNWTTAGGDFEATAVAEAKIAATDTWVSWEVGPVLNQWLAGKPNNGFLLKSDGILEEAEFYSKEEADASLRPRLTITYACECGTACLAPQGSGNILMVVLSPTTLVNEDQQAKDLFESWGYTVSFISESANQSSYDSAVAANDVVFISETVNSNSVGSKLVSATIGVVSQDGDYNPDLGLATGSTVKVGTDIDITSTDHYITRPFRVGPLPIYDAGMEQLVTTGPLTGGQQTLAAVGGDASLVLLDQGEALEGGGSAAGRRVVLPLGTRYRFDSDHLNGNGQLIVQRAIAWGMGAGNIDAGDLLLVVGSASNPTTKDTDRRDLFESWGYTVTLIDDGADQISFNTAMAATDIVYVAESIAEVTLADKLTDSAVGIVNEDGMMLDKFGLGSDVPPITVTWNTYTTTDAGHYISEPFAGAGVTLFSDNIVMPLVKGTHAPDLMAPGLIGLQTILVTLEAGAKRWDEVASSGRRVHLPFGAASISQLEPDGLTLMQRSLAWAAGAGPKYGLIAHWRLDEGTGLIAVDSVGGHDGTLLNGPAWTDGAINGGVHFSDESHAVSVPHSDTLTMTGDLTLLAWVKLDQLLPNRPIIQKGTGNIDHNYFFGLYNDNMQFAVSPPGGGWHVKSSGPTGILPGSWHHLAVSFDDSTNVVTFYLDGIPFAKQELTHSPSEFAGPLKIGRNRFNYGIKGRVDEVRIYRGVLDETEIAELAVKPPELLLVVGEPNGLSLHDIDRRDRIEEWGYNVALIDDDATQAEFDAAVSLSDVIYVRSSVSWSVLGDKLDNADKGLLNETVNLINDFGFASGFSFYDSTGFSSTNASHSITSPYSGAAVTTFSLTNRMYGPDGTLSPDLVTVGSSGGGPAGEPSLATLESGAATYDGGTTPGRRVHLPISGITTTDMTADGRDILQRAIDWAAGEGENNPIGGGGGGGAAYVEKFNLFTIPNADTWHPVDLSTVDVPPNAVAEIAILNSQTGNERWGGVRAYGSSLDRRLSLHEAEGGGVDAVVMHVQTNENGWIEAYSDVTTEVTFRILGYWTGATYVERFDAFKAGGNNSWRNHDLSGFGVNANQVAEIAAANKNKSKERLVGVRRTGSSMERRLDIHEAESGGVDVASWFVNADNSAEIQVFAESNNDVDFYVIGFWSDPPGTYHETGGQHGQAVTENAWHSADSTSWGFPPNSIGQFAMSNEAGDREREIGMRAATSTSNRRLDLQEAESGGADLASFHIPLDTSGRFSIYAEPDAEDGYFYPLGWWVLN